MYGSVQIWRSSFPMWKYQIHITANISLYRPPYCAWFTVNRHSWITRLKNPDIIGESIKAKKKKKKKTHVASSKIEAPSGSRH